MDDMNEQPLPQSEDPVLLQLQRSLASVYKVERLLGRGGMAAVYQAVEINPPRPVALKVLPPGLGLGAAAARFKREARLAVSLNHPNIVPIYRVGLTAGAYFFAMKLVEGRTLDAIVESQGALPLPAILVVLRATTTALAYAHERGGVHGDLKGANILVDRDGRVMVSDFGIARAVEEEAPAAAGKTRIRIPEQIAGGTVGPAADQYSLGIVAMQMISGSLPPESLGPTPDVRAGRGGIPDTLVQVVQTALARDPARRYPSAADMLTAIEAIPFGDAERREAYGVLGKLARGEQVPKLRVSAPMPTPPPAPPRPEATVVGRPTTPRPAGAPTPAAKPAPPPPPSTPTIVSTPLKAAPAAPAPRPPSPTPRATPAPPTPHAPAAPIPRGTFRAPAPPPAPPAEPIAPIPRGTYETPAAPPPPTEPAMEAIGDEVVEPAPRAATPAPAAAARRSAPALFAALSPEPKKHTRVIAVAAVVVVVAAAAAAYLLLVRKPAATPLAQAPAATQAAPPPAQPVTPAPVAAETARADTTRRPAAAPAAPKGDTTLANETTGLLLISTVPNTAEISVDGQPAGNGGFLDSEVTAGRRRVRVYAPGYEALDTTVRVAAGATLNLGQVTLQPSATEAAPVPAAAAATGKLRLRTVPPTAEIFVDGQSVGVGGLVDFEVAAGQRQLRISAPGYLTLDTLITVDAGATVRLGQLALRASSP